MHEIELKFQVPGAQRAAVDAAVAGRGRAARVRLQAAYVDTPERALAQAGLALRMRREGRQWVQTLKGTTADSMTRLEHNVPRGTPGAMPPIDPTLHAGTPAGDALHAVLVAQPADLLAVRYDTDMRRRTRRQRVPGGQVELAFDLGHIRAGGRALPVCELEIELLSGTPRAVLATARRWVAAHGLWLDTRSKAERGDLLAGGATMAPPVRAAAAVLLPGLGEAAAWRRVLRACAGQILGNASQIASGEHLPEHVHQLRVGLRRLRSALRLFEGVAHDADLAEAAALLFRRLGVSRDATVIESEFAAELAAAMRADGLADEGAPLPHGAAGEPPADVLRDPRTQGFLLALLEATLEPPDELIEPGPALRDELAQRLDRWHRRLLRDGADLAALDDEALHRLRKRAKRLRYAAEFCAALFERRAVRRYLKAMDGLQDRLGAVTDTLMASRAFRDAGASQPRHAFALGWLAARRRALIEHAADELDAFRKVARFWRE